MCVCVCLFVFLLFHGIAFRKLPEWEGKGGRVQKNKSCVCGIMCVSSLVSVRLCVCVCVCVRARARARACACVYVRERERGGERERERETISTYYATKYTFSSFVCTFNIFLQICFCTGKCQCFVAKCVYIFFGASAEWHYHCCLLTNKRFQ